MINLKRIYEPVEAEDGFRILVEWLWHRGISKDRTALDLWLKEAASSPDLLFNISIDTHKDRLTIDLNCTLVIPARAGYNQCLSG
jgi:uncharacterized protein YeaO (DUF488 family)